MAFFKGGYDRVKLFSHFGMVYGFLGALLSYVDPLFQGGFEGDFTSFLSWHLPFYPSILTSYLFANIIVLPYLLPDGGILIASPLTNTLWSHLTIFSNPIIWMMQLRWISQQPYNGFKHLVKLLPTGYKFMWILIIFTFITLVIFSNVKESIYCGGRPHEFPSQVISDCTCNGFQVDNDILKWQIVRPLPHFSTRSCIGIITDRYCIEKIPPKYTKSHRINCNATTYPQN